MPAPGPRTSHLPRLALPAAKITTLLLLATSALVVVSGVGNGSLVAVMLAAAAILVAALRSVLTIHQVSTFAESHRLSLVDDLTGLPSRRAFIAALHDATAPGSVRPERFAVVLLDLDEFRELNDTLGHAAGDLVIERVAGRLLRVVGSGALLARLGGDEFAALVPRSLDRPGADRPLELAGRALRAIRRPLAIEGIEIALSASVGVALHPEHASDARGLLRLADVAMYQAKRQRLSVALYRRGMDPHSRERLALVAQVGQAVRRDELVLHYQPQLDVATGEISGLEALVRWRKPDGNLVPPREFLPVAERHGLMPAVTAQVLRSVTAQQVQWLRRGLHCPVAINLSTSDLRDPGLPARIAATLSSAGVPPALLEVEVTEHLLMSDPDGANAVLNELRAMGVRVALDDFGTGHSSLAYVQRLALDALKLDRRFVLGTRSSTGDATIIRLSIELAEAFGLKVIGEGVEDRETADALRAMGCDAVQGYWVSAPLPACDVPGWMARHQPQRWAA